MKKERPYILLVAVIVMGAGVQAEDFTLTGTEHKDVTKNYDRGWLYDFSTANILPGGSVGFSESNGLYAVNSSSVNISGGSVGNLYTGDSSRVHVFGGSIQSLTAADLRLNGPERVNISGGNVGTLRAGFNLVGGQFSFTGEVSDLTTWRAYGVQAVDGTVNSIELDYVQGNDSNVNISGGSVGGVSVNGFNFVSIGGGNVGFVNGRAGTNVGIFGGSVGSVFVTMGCEIGIFDGDVDRVEFGNASYLSISGGNVGEVYAESEAMGLYISGGNIATVNVNDAYIPVVSIGGCNVTNLNFGSLDRTGRTINIGGVGTVGTLHVAQLDLHEDVFSFSGLASDLASFGVQAIDGAVSNVEINRLYLSYQTLADISGGSVDTLYADYSSSVNISGGSVNSLLANNGSTITFYGQTFVLGGSLWLDGYELIGTGILSGQWLDGTSWTTQISQNDATATILLIPEPATLSLLALGGLLLRKRRKA